MSATNPGDNAPDPSSEQAGKKYVVPSEIPSPAGYLGAAGLIPFIALILLAFFANKPEQRTIAHSAFATYSAIILSFLGGVRWGAALAFTAWRPMLVAVGPSVYAFLCLLLKPASAIPLLALMFIVVAFGDWARISNPLWPDWFKRLRIRLSVAVVVMHVLLMAGFNP